jgi:hypothetical protein
MHFILSNEHQKKEKAASSYPGGPSSVKPVHSRPARFRIVSMKLSHKLIVVSAAALLVSYLAWEWYLSPQARIEHFLVRIAAAAEEKDTDTLLSAFSQEYSDIRGQNYETLADTIEQGFEKVDRLNITLEAVRSEVAGDEAKASFDLIVVGVRGEERYLLVGRPMAPEKMRVALIKEAGEWKIMEVVQSREY